MHKHTNAYTRTRTHNMYNRYTDTPQSMHTHTCKIQRMQTHHTNHTHMYACTHMRTRTTCIHNELQLAPTHLFSRGSRCGGGLWPLPSPGGAGEGSRLPRDLKRVTTSETNHMRAATMEPSTPPPLPEGPADTGCRQSGEGQLRGAYTCKEGILMQCTYQVKSWVSMWSKGLATLREITRTQLCKVTHALCCP